MRACVYFLQLLQMRSVALENIPVEHYRIFLCIVKTNTFLVTKTTTLAAHRVTLTRAATLKIFVVLLSTTVVYSGYLQTSVNQCNTIYLFTVKSLNIGTCMSEQTVYILIRLLLRSSLIRIYTVCHSFYIFWRHYFLVKLNCFILRTTTVAGLGVPIFRVFTVQIFARP